MSWNRMGKEVPAQTYLEQDVLSQTLLPRLWNILGLLSLSFTISVVSDYKVINQLLI